MKARINKHNALIYLLFGLVSIILLTTSGLFFYFDICNYCKDLLLGIGCSTIATILTAYFFEKNTIQHDFEKNKKFRNSFLSGLPFGIFCVSRVIIEYYIDDYIKNGTLKDLFEKSVKKMEAININDDNCLYYCDEKKKLLEKLNYGLSLCSNNSKFIKDKSLELEINEIFSKDELLTLGNICTVCEKIENCNRINDMAEYIRILVDFATDSIPEVKAIFNRIIFLENKTISNWNDFIK